MSGATRFWAKRYRDEGFGRQHPVPSFEKGPRISGWQHATKKFAIDEFEDDGNVGTALVGDLVDVDLDEPEAVRLAPFFLPPTDRVHGRPGKPRSHHWYRSAGAKSVQFKDVPGPNGKTPVLVEIRAGSGHQTLLPPSTHPSGEKLAWEADGEPCRTDVEALKAAVRNLATSALLARHWPTGSRHGVALHAAGFLAARGLDGKVIEEIVRRAAEAAGDEEVEDRAHAARDTVNTFEAGGKTAGGPTLEESVGKDVIEILTKWWGTNSTSFDSIVAEMNRTRFGVRLGKDYVYGLEQDDKIVFQKKEALFEEFVNDRIKVGEKQRGERLPIYRTRFEIWREHAKKRSYREVVFCPPPLIADPRDYNLWTGFAVDPILPPNGHPARESREVLAAWAEAEAKPKCQLFLDLARDVICSGNDEHFNYLVKLLAYTVQCPGVPSEIAVAMKGKQGAGKGTFARMFGSLFGRHFIHLDRTEQLAGKFNAALSAKVVVFADEAFFAGDRKDLGALKRLITEPTLAIERKGMDVVQEPNFMHLFMATNEDWAHQAGENERRFLTLKVSDHRMQDLEFFNAINEQMRDGGREALLSYLQTRNVTADDVRRVPKTEELQVQQQLSLRPEMQWWCDVLEAGVLDLPGCDDRWPAEINATQLHEKYLRWCDAAKVNRRVLSAAIFSRETLKPWLGEARTATAGPLRGKQVRLLLPLDQAREVFDQKTGMAVSWPKPEGGSHDVPF